MIIDPNNVAWIVKDPLGRTISLSNELADIRESVGKHTGNEFLSRMDAKETVINPDRIDISSNNPKRDIYYRSRGKIEIGPYERVVVEMDGDYGEAISWSIYDKPVSSSGVRYWKGGQPWRHI